MELFNNEDLLLKTSDGKPPVGCTACENGICNDTGLGCDGCYENSMKLLRELL